MQVINYEQWGNVVPVVAIIGGAIFLALIIWIGVQLMRNFDTPVKPRGKVK